MIAIIFITEKNFSKNTSYQFLLRLNIFVKNAWTRNTPTYEIY